MIFDNNFGAASSINEASIQPCKYDLGFGGALMLVYENECNYNAMMEAVGLSELKYYQETGKDLFLNEAGAFSNFLETAKKFFMKVIEKIKSIFNKFFMMIRAKFGDDKAFVKKYEKQLLRVDTTDLEFEGYNFPKDLESDLDTSTITDLNIYKKFVNMKTVVTDSIVGDYDTPYKTSDDVNDKKEIERAKLINSKSNKLDIEDFKDELQELLYGGSEKETLEIGKDVTIRECLTNIKNAEKAIAYAKKFESKHTKAIDSVIKELDKKIKEFAPVLKNDPTGDEARNTAIKSINQCIEILKSESNDITILCGMGVKAIQDQRNQCKAICIKAINYKHEAAVYGGYSESAGIFDDVVIR